MIDKNLYRETFSQLHASDRAKQEVFQNMQEIKHRKHLPRVLRGAAIATSMVMALAVTAGAVNVATDGALFRQFTIVLAEDNLYLAQKKGVDVWTAVQAYNFGPAYIDFIAQNGKENTLALAKQYSRETVAPLLGNTTGKTYSYIHPISIFHGAELYVNG